MPGRLGMIGARFSKHRTMIATTIGYSIGLCTVVITPKADVSVGGAKLQMKNFVPIAAVHVGWEF